MAYFAFVTLHDNQGDPVRKNSASSLFLALLVAGAVISPPASAQGKVISRDSFGCVSEDYFDRLVTVSVSGDSRAFSQGLSAGLISGQCISLKRGTLVQLESAGLFSGKIQVRPNGEMQSYWTIREAVAK